MIKSGFLSPVSSIKGVGKKFSDIFVSKGIETIGDLLRIFPSEYIDPSELSEEVVPGAKRLYVGDIKGIRISRGWGKGSGITIVDCIVCGENSELIFFNQPYLKKNLSEVEELFFIGKAEDAGSRYKFTAPVILKDLKDGYIKPLYRRVGTVTGGRLEKFIRSALDNMGEEEEFLPASVVKKREMTSAVEALRKIHFPLNSRDDAEEGHFRFRYVEFFFFWFELEYGRKILKPGKKSHHYTIDNSIKKSLREAVPFELTDGQKSSVKDVFADMTSDSPMSRLLLGDVGTGKTVVAFIALMVAVKNGYQGAFLAPTEILVDQHYRKAVDFFGRHKVAKLTAGMKTAERRSVLESLASGEIEVVFGTHSLIGESVCFKNLSLVVVDEQHRFGVAQRARLCYKGTGTDVLVMTATPIPRTLMLSIYKDLALSVIKEKPSDRKPILTRNISVKERSGFYKKLKAGVEAGSKVYVVLPLIDVSEFQPELLAVEQELEWYEKIFGKNLVGSLTGRTGSEDKQRIMDDFYNGHIRVLVSTTVIEVGIDVPDATVMVIENADRYGMAQLHQLRGRVGRGSDFSYCYLITPDKMTESGKNRIETVVSCGDGFKLAEEDLKNRGGGEFLGTAQSGGMNFTLSEITRDYDIFKASEEDVADLTSGEYTDYMKSRLEILEKRLKTINFS